MNPPGEFLSLAFSRGRRNIPVKMTRTSRSTARPVALTALVLLMAGCRENPVSFYEVPHDHGAPSAPGMAMAGSRTASTMGSDPGRLEWTKPETWTEKPVTEMRLASYGFTAPDGTEADVSVFSFPDAAGGLLANINRWRGQVGLEAVVDEQLETTARRIEVTGLPAWQVDFTGPAGVANSATPTRIVGAIVPLGGNAWFFKMMGPAATVESQVGAFDALVGSIRAVTPAPAARVAAGADPHAGVPGAPPLTGDPGNMMDPSLVPPPPGQEGFLFEVPEGWQQQPGTQFRLASFLIPGPGVPDADMAVSAFPGMVGQDLANVNRWRGQVGLGPIDQRQFDETAAVVQSNGLVFRVFDMEGTNSAVGGGRKTRILAGMMTHGETTWFFKMTGESGHVAGQRESFLGFLRSFRFDHAH